MVKKKVKTKSTNTRKNDIYKAIVACALVLVLALASGLIYKNMQGKESEYTVSKAVAQEEDLSFYDSNSCRCIERERWRCTDGFELDEGNRSCRNGNEVTNVILGCSIYECSGDTYVYNKQKGEWEKKLPA